MPSAPQEPVAIYPPVNIERMEHFVDLSLGSVTLQSTVWETHRTVQWTPITGMGPAAMISMTTVLKGHARHSTLNAGSTSVSLIHISILCIWLWRHFCPTFKNE